MQNDNTKIDSLDLPMGTEINIRGRIYSIDLTGYEVIKLTKRFERRRRRCPRSAPFPWLDRMVQLHFLRLCWNYIECLLGEGACERYFGARACSVEQMLGLLGHLADEIEKQR